MDHHPSTSSGPRTQRAKPWTVEELQRLRAFAHRPATKAEILREFPDRTLSAARVQLLKIRRELGIPASDKQARLIPMSIEPTMLKPDDPGLPCRRDQQDWRKSAERANQKFLAALLRLAA